VAYAGTSPNALPTTWRFRLFGKLFRFVSRLLSRPSSERLPDLGDDPVVFVANHTSMSDVFYAIATLSDWKYPARCLVRYSYFKNPLMGTFLRTVDCVAAGGGGTDAVAVAVEILETGLPVAVMVEGRIVPPDERADDGMGEFRDGFVTIARNADARVLPIVITNADRVWGSRATLPTLRLRNRPRVDVRVGTPFSVDELVDSEAIAEARSQMAAMLARP
jgi:1-acyl-sn-glycerol-3-phosphate acyltransferase